jgi:Cupredoxin-like domain
MLLVALVTVVLSAVVLRAEPESYVVTAIDYHFHDAHPTRPLVSGQDFVVENQGRNLHNVTIPALGFSEDVRPGDRVTIEDIADRLAPGRYELFCQIHLTAFGMKGVIVIASR